jgi:hypothetical protein
MKIVIPSCKQKSQNDTTSRLAVSVEEAAEMLSVSTRSIWNMCSRGEIQSRKIGSRTVFTVASLEAFIHGTDNSVQKQK